MSERVVVAMSGGVDSSVAAALLVERGFDVVGVMLRLWSEADATPAEARQDAHPDNRCCTLESVSDARSVAVRLGIPFYVVDAAAPFHADVVVPFIDGYRQGLTPNPCITCNRRIRFGFLWRQAQLMGATALATGHYARLLRIEAGSTQLLRGIDMTKDQSYVLSMLEREVLSHALFPIGEFTKAEVRALAAQRGLPTASKRDSQDLCFVTDGDYRRFLRDWAPETLRPGPIIDRAGRQLGTHQGLAAFTIGQRSGLGIAAPHPLYVVAKELGQNALVVGPASDLGIMRLRTHRVHWVSGVSPATPFRAQIQVRYRARPVDAQLIPLPDGSMEAELDCPVRDVTPGQAAVFYRGDLCLGGGIIKESVRYV